MALPKPRPACPARALSPTDTLLNVPPIRLQLKELEKLMPMAAGPESLKDEAPSQADDEATLANLQQQRLVSPASLRGSRQGTPCCPLRLREGAADGCWHACSLA